MLPAKPTNAADIEAASPAVTQRAHLPECHAAAVPQLFRSEALVHRETQWLGTVLLEPARSDRAVIVVTMLILVAVLGLLFFGEFTRKARVEGWLVPQQGLVRVFAPQPGVVTALYVREGAQVHKGDRLLKLSGELQSARLGATQAEIVRRLSELHESLLEERRQHERLLAQRQRTYGDRLSTLKLELEEVDRNIGTMQKRVQLAERSTNLHRKLRADGFISEQQLHTLEGDRLEQEARLGALRRQYIELKREQLTLEGELKDLPVKIGADITAIQRNIVEAEQELAQAEARREIIVAAPQDGTVTTMLVDDGGQATPAAPLLSIIPAGTTLEAHLYGPSRAIGFVHPGQKVLLRYQAYPYQKFGHYEGVAISISQSAVSPGELPMQLTGVLGPANTAPVYRIKVQLASQTVTAYGKAIPLQPGMQLEADIALDRRRLYEWMLDPLYTVTGRP